MSDHLTTPGPMARRPVACAAIAWATGSAAGYASQAPFWLWLVLALPFLTLTVWRRRASAVFAALAFLSAGYTAWQAIQPPAYERVVCTIEGVVCAEPKEYDDGVSLTLRDVTASEEAYPYRARIFLYTRDGDCPTIWYGDRVTIADTALAEPKDASGANGYDRAAALWRAGIGVSGYASITDLTVGAAETDLLSRCMALRRTLVRLTDDLFGEAAPMARSLLLGDKSRLPEELYEDFQVAGISHILAVSGLHVSVLAMAVYWFLRYILRLSRKTAYFITLPLLALYAAVTAFPASILRAILLFALMEAAPIIGRPTDRATGLAATYLVLAVANPLGAFDAGFLLSFTAMLGLTTILPTLNGALPDAGRSVWRRGARRWLLTPALASISATLGMLPVISSLYGSYTLWSVLSNVPAILLATAALPVTAITLALGAVCPDAGLTAAHIADPALYGLSALASFAARLPGLQIRLPVMRWYVVAAYAVCGLAASPQIPLGRLRGKRAARGKLAFIAMLLLIAGLARLQTELPARSVQGLTITFVDVGQGDGALVNAQGTLYAIDTGESSAMPETLRSEAVELEAVFLSHPDDDHAGAVAEVLESGRCERVYLPECWSRMDVPEEIAQSLESVEIVWLSTGDELRLSDDVTCEVLHPPEGYLPASDNAGSLVLLLRYGSGSAIFLGDLPDSEIHFPLPDCDLVKLAHHGAESSSSVYQLMALSPSAAILSVGENGYGHPSEEVLRRLDNLGIRTFRTDLSGDIKATIASSGGVTIALWRDETAEAEQ